jgi:hypothetical protein
MSLRSVEVAVDEGRLGFDGLDRGKETPYRSDGAVNPRILGMIAPKLLLEFAHDGMSDSMGTQRIPLKIDAPHRSYS